MAKKSKSLFFNCLVEIQHGLYDPWEGVFKGVVEGPSDTAFYLIQSDNGKMYYIPVGEVGFFSILKHPQKRVPQDKLVSIIQIKHLKLIKG